MQVRSLMNEKRLHTISTWRLINTLYMHLKLIKWLLHEMWSIKREDILLPISTLSQLRICRPSPPQFWYDFHERCGKCWNEWKINFSIFILRFMVIFVLKNLIFFYLLRGGGWAGKVTSVSFLSEFQSGYISFVHKWRNREFGGFVMAVHAS